MSPKLCTECGEHEIASQGCDLCSFCLGAEIGESEEEKAVDWQIKTDRAKRIRDGFRMLHGEP